MYYPGAGAGLGTPSGPLQAPSAALRSGQALFLYWALMSRPKRIQNDYTAALRLVGWCASQTNSRTGMGLVDKQANAST